MLGENGDPSVVAEIFVTRPINGSELYENQLLSPIKDPASYCPRFAEILEELVKTCLNEALSGGSDKPRLTKRQALLTRSVKSDRLLG